MKVVLTSQGSTGDIFPMIGLARALKQAGHTVVFATIANYQAEIERAGIAFYQLPPYWEQEVLNYWMGRLQSLRSPIFQLNELYKAALPDIPEMIKRIDALLDGYDLLVSSYLFPANKFLADRRGIPFATFAFAHNTVPSLYYPPEDFPRLKWLPLKFQMKWNAFLWVLCNRVVDWVINRTIAKQLEACKLPKVKNFFSKPADLVLVALSPTLMKPDCKLDERFQFVGYSRWQNASSSLVEQEVLNFVQGKKVPVLTFGSMVYADPKATMTTFLSNWPRDQKIIIQTGWAEFPKIPEYENALFIGKVCHDWLFQLASVVIHHGGAGTTASVLFSGKPQIIVPHIGDQNFFGRKIECLKVGIRCKRKDWVKKLYQKYGYVLEHPDFAREALKAQEVLKDEQGAERAVAVLEDFVNAQSAISTEGLSHAPLVGNSL